ncbi:hypothetical protein GCM10009775_31180 [Microbacterium aoyamense]|uniref:Uncharacterized protein n=1 Tax=Microbacterium aoyamense TaxID=344166 RepID=A0ABN2PWR0_9MICO|nr:hypothetical protein [Microbacterium aoyamense]
MQILIAFIVGAAIGLAIHFVVPDRGTRGIAVGPIVGAAAAGLVWLLLTWAGVGIDTPWPWLSTLVAPLVTWPVLAVMSSLRVKGDARRKAELKLL